MLQTLAGEQCRALVALLVLVPAGARVVLKSQGCSEQTPGKTGRLCILQICPDATIQAGRARGKCMAPARSPRAALHHRPLIRASEQTC